MAHKRYIITSQLKIIEKVKSRAMSWIYGYNSSYVTKLKTANLLPVSIYMELHDVLLFWKTNCGNYDIAAAQYVSWNTNQTTRQGNNNEFEKPKYRLCKSDENFWKRAALLYNIFSKKIDFSDATKLKQNLTRVYWNYVETQYKRTSSVHLAHPLPLPTMQSSWKTHLTDQ